MPFDASPTPDLASILRSLAACAPATAPHHAFSRYDQSGQSTNPDPSPSRLPELEDGEYDPNNPLITSKPTPNHYLGSHRLASTTSQPQNPPLVDVTTITTYPVALRYITKTIARDEDIMPRLRKLVSVQHQHEQQWWQGRVALQRKQSGREEGRKKVGDVLKAVGGKIDATLGPTPEDDAAELALYDKKVHRACLEMVNATRTELRNMGIPFFAIRKSLLARGNEEAAMTPDVVLPTPSLQESQLRALESKVLELLELLCQD